MDRNHSKIKMEKKKITEKSQKYKLKMEKKKIIKNIKYRKTKQIKMLGGFYKHKTNEKKTTIKIKTW